MSREGKNFGNGGLEGVIAPETAAHAAGTSALLPMLALGIPGSPTAAVLLGGLLIWGLQPGPLLFVEQKYFVWGLIASMYLGNIVGLLVVLSTVPLFAAILRIPFSIIAPVIIVICAIGAYTVHNAMLDVWYMLAFGVMGYVFKKIDIPLAPLVLAIVLGDKAEDSFRQAMLSAQGDLSIMWSNPLVGSITTLALVLLFWPLLSKVLVVLRPVPHVVCVRITRSLARRVEWVMEHLGTDDAALAEAEVSRSDRARAARMNEQFDVTWGDPLLYDLVLNTDRVSVDSCVEQIRLMTTRPEFAETPGSHALLANLALQARVRVALKEDPATRE